MYTFTGKVVMFSKIVFYLFDEVGYVFGGVCLFVSNIT